MGWQSAAEAVPAPKTTMLPAKATEMAPRVAAIRLLVFLLVFIVVPFRPGGLLLRATVPFPGLVNSESCFPADTSTSYCSQRLDRLGILPNPGEDAGVVSATTVTSTDRVCDLDGLDTAAPHLEPPACQDWQKSVTTTTGFE
ncbi:hypothetical protein AB0M12_12315 [Nocardia vinacea]|uniref:hypothetical protein n=1 Tax=Nocardia vinacea TaxID=96468 RepID=UPI00342EA640